MTIPELTAKGFLFQIMRSGYRVWFQEPTTKLLRNPVKQVADVKFEQNMEEVESRQLAREAALAHLVKLRLEQ